MIVSFPVGGSLHHGGERLLDRQAMKRERTFSVTRRRPGTFLMPWSLSAQGDCCIAHWMQRAINQGASVREYVGSSCPNMGFFDVIRSAEVGGFSGF